MKTTILTLLAIVGLSLSSYGQTNAVAPDPVSPFTVGTNAPASTNSWFGPHVGGVIDFLSQSGSNWTVIPFVTFLEDDQREELGGGIAAIYSISDYAGAMLRLDYLDGEVYMPSGNFQLQLPITLFGKVQAVPFALTGVATSLNSGEDDGDVIGIVGTGLGVRVSDRIGVVYGIEYWTGFSGYQHRLGVAIRF